MRNPSKIMSVENGSNHVRLNDQGRHGDCSGRRKLLMMLLEKKDSMK